MTIIIVIGVIFVGCLSQTDSYYIQSKSPSDGLTLCLTNPQSDLCRSLASRRNRRQASFSSSGDDFCDGNKMQFGNQCNSRFSDNGQGDFCSNYGVRCRGWRRVVPTNTVVGQQRTTTSGNQVSQPQTFVPSGSRQNNPLPPSVGQGSNRAVGTIPQSQNSVQYCKTYGRDYYLFCLQGSVPDYSNDFCNGFSQACPGVPAPGTYVPNGKAYPYRQQRVSPYRTGLPIHSSPNWGYQTADWKLPGVQEPLPVYPGPAASQLWPTSQFSPTNPLLPANGLSSLPSVPSSPLGGLPTGGLPSVPSSPLGGGLPTGGLPSIPSSPLGGLPTGGLPSIPSSPLGGLPTGGLPTGGLPSIPSSPLGGLPTGGLPSLPSSPLGGGLPTGGLPSIPSSPLSSLPTGGLPSLPSGGLPSLPSLPTGGLPSLPSSGGLPTGGLSSIPSLSSLG